MTKSQRNILITKENTTLYRQTFGFYPCTTSFNAGEQMQRAALVEPLSDAPDHKCSGAVRSDCGCSDV